MPGRCGRKHGQIVVNINDIIGKQMGKFEVLSYAYQKYSYTAGGPRLRHYYNCRVHGKETVVVRGTILASHRKKERG